MVHMGTASMCRGNGIIVAGTMRDDVKKYFDKIDTKVQCRSMCARFGWCTVRLFDLVNIHITLV